MPLPALRTLVCEALRFTHLLLSSFSLENLWVRMGVWMGVPQSFPCPFLTCWPIFPLFFLQHGSAWLRSPCKRGWGQLEKNLEIGHTVTTKSQEELTSFLLWSGQQVGGGRAEQGLDFCEYTRSSLLSRGRLAQKAWTICCLCLSSINQNEVCIQVSNQLKVLSKIKIVSCLPSIYQHRVWDTPGCQCMLLNK